MKKTVFFRTLAAVLVALVLCACAKVSMVDKIEHFVSEFARSYESYSFSDCEKSCSTFKSLLSQYEETYNDLSLGDYDRIEDAISVFRLLMSECAQFFGQDFLEQGDLSKVMYKGIEYDFEAPSIGQINDWIMMNKDFCSEKFSELNPDQEYKIPEEMTKEHPCLVYLVLSSESLAEKKEKQSWFDLYPLMNQDQKDKLYDILYRESYKLGLFERKMQASQYNQEAYDYAKAGDFYHAYETIDKAISLYPSDPNYYDSKGEFYLMQYRSGRALAMWNKVLELDPDFLSKHDGHTSLYDGLVEKGYLNK